MLEQGEIPKRPRVERRPLAESRESGNLSRSAATRLNVTAIALSEESPQTRHGLFLRGSALAQPVGGQKRRGTCNVCSLGRAQVPGACALLCECMDPSVHALGESVKCLGAGGSENVCQDFGDDSLRHVDEGLLVRVQVKGGRVVA